MNLIGNYAPDHEAVGFIYPDRGEVFVPWDEPAKGSALIHLEVLDGEFAIHEGDDEVAVTHIEVPTPVSLAVIFGVLLLSMLFSVVVTRNKGTTPNIK